MAQIAPAQTKINTEVTQETPGHPSRRSVVRGKARLSARGPVRVPGDARRSVRDPAGWWSSWTTGPRCTRQRLTAVTTSMNRKSTTC
jgi:hypothetical protein